MARVKAKTADRASGAKKVLSADDINARLFAAYSEQSRAVEKELFNSFPMEDISGFYPSSLVLSLCFGKIVSGLYVSSGPEQSAKSTSLATIMGQSFAEGTLIHKHVDVERAMRSNYMGKIVSRYAGVPWDDLKQQDNADDNPRYRWITETSLEDVFTEIQFYLESLPDKVYIPDRKEWFLVFENDNPNTRYKATFARIDKALDKDSKLSDKKFTYYSVGDNSSFQVFYAIDSIKALTLKSIEERKKGFHQPGLMAKALAEYLPYVKGLLRPKHSVLFCINQMYINPMEKFGDPLYETAGNALKLNSDARCIQKPTSVRDGFKRSKDNGKVCVEPSVIGNGEDSYTFKSILNIKGKFNDTPYIRGTMRIWSSGPGFLPGIDPVYDTAAFLEIIGLASIGTSKGMPCVKLVKHKALEGYSGDIIPWMDFKAEILAECGQDTGAEPSQLREICFDLIESKQADALYQERGLLASGKDHLAVDDSSDDLD